MKKTLLTLSLTLLAGAAAAGNTTAPPRPSASEVAAAARSTAQLECISLGVAAADMSACIDWRVYFNKVKPFVQLSENASPDPNAVVVVLGVRAPGSDTLKANFFREGEPPILLAGMRLHAWAVAMARPDLPGAAPRAVPA